MNNRGKKAVILGASMAGLAAAAALRGHFESVTVIERDRLTDDTRPRRGVGQGNHLHNLLKGGESSIEALLPGVRQKLLDAGAVELRNAEDVLFYDHGHWLPRRDLGYVNVAASRPLIELVTRRALCAYPNVRILDETAVASLHWVDGVVAGVDIRSARGADTVLKSDLVVDCTGQSTKLPAWLAAKGWGSVPTISMETGLSYTTAFCSPPTHTSEQYRAMVVFPSAPRKRGCFAAEIEGKRWQISLATRFERDLPTTLDEMIAFADGIEVPQMAEFLRHSELQGKISSYRKPRATWRRYDKLPSMPEGLLVLGDAIASFNPIYGQGISVAWLQAFALAKLLKEASSDQSCGQLAATYLRQAMDLSRDAWLSCAVEDCAYPEVMGDRPRDLDFRIAYVGAVRRLLIDDCELHRDYVGVSQLTSSVAELTRPDRAARIMALVNDMASQRNVEHALIGH